jgi:hypothetical protein
MILLLNGAEELFQQIRMTLSILFFMKWSFEILTLINFYFKKPQPVTKQTAPLHLHCPHNTSIKQKMLKAYDFFSLLTYGNILVNEFYRRNVNIPGLFYVLDVFLKKWA